MPSVCTSTVCTPRGCCDAAHLPLPRPCMRRAHSDLLPCMPPPVLPCTPSTVEAWHAQQCVRALQDPLVPFELSFEFTAADGPAVNGCLRGVPLVPPGAVASGVSQAAGMPGEADALTRRKHVMMMVIPRKVVVGVIFSISPHPDASLSHRAAFSSSLAWSFLRCPSQLTFS